MHIVPFNRVSTRAHSTSVEAWELKSPSPQSKPEKRTQPAAATFTKDKQIALLQTIPAHGAQSRCHQSVSGQLAVSNKRIIRLLKSVRSVDIAWRIVSLQAMQIMMAVLWGCISRVTVTKARKIVLGGQADMFCGRPATRQDAIAAALVRPPAGASGFGLCQSVCHICLSIVSWLLRKSLCVLRVQSKIRSVKVASQGHEVGPVMSSIRGGWMPHFIASATAASGMVDLSGS